MRNFLLNLTGNILQSGKGSSVQESTSGS